jgi:two-component system response regulator FixJ
MPIVYIVDDDSSTRRALARLMRSAGCEGVPYSSVDEFLQSEIHGENVCVVADVHMPGTNALELPRLLRERGLNVPVIFLTADYSDVTRERIHQTGGSGYFKKPVDDQNLIDMIRWAMITE